MVNTTSFSDVILTKTWCPITSYGHHIVSWVWCCLSRGSPSIWAALPIFRLGINRGAHARLWHTTCLASFVGMHNHGEIICWVYYWHRSYDLHRSCDSLPHHWFQELFVSTYHVYFVTFVDMCGRQELDSLSLIYSLVNSRFYLCEQYMLTYIIGFIDKACWGWSCFQL